MGLERQTHALPCADGDAGPSVDKRTGWAPETSSEDSPRRPPLTRGRAAWRASSSTLPLQDARGFAAPFGNGIRQLFRTSRRMPACTAVAQRHALSSSRRSPFCRADALYDESRRVVRACHGASSRWGPNAARWAPRAASSLLTKLRSCQRLLRFVLTQSPSQRRGKGAGQHGTDTKS